MKCISYCTAVSYDLVVLSKIFKDEDINFFATIFDNVLHLRLDGDDSYELFFFDYGCYVLWEDRPLNEELKILLDEKLRKVSHKPLQDENFLVEDTIFYVYAEQNYIVEEEDTLFIKNDSLVKLSMSHALSQSVKLSFFENSIMETIESSKPLTNELASRGRTSLSHHALGRKIGNLFAARQSINLHTDILDTPEFFWRRPMYEPYYQSVAEFMDLGPRIDILNRRLDVIQELYQMLSDELRHQHSSRLEWIIIVLIMFEVALGLLSYLT